MEYDSILETVGGTPLVRMRRLGQGLEADLYAKVEYFNPGGSVKDRIALSMLLQAEREGLVHKGTTIIEATAGNTGTGLALVAAVRGYRCIFVLPDKMSSDKVQLLEAYGAETVIVPTNVGPDDPQNYNVVADRLAREIPNAFRPNQFENRANPHAHYETTGPEIWNDTAGGIDVFVAGVGTGGTVSGVGRYLKERKPSVKIVVADPVGSVLSGADSPGSWKVEGIGEDFFPDNFERELVDEYVTVSDEESFCAARALARREGLLVGGSSGTAMAAALRYARRERRAEKVVVMMPDTGRNYLSKMFNETWMRANCFETRVEEYAAAGPGDE
ncbi:MAG: cysteine synthase family protein [Actinobacteria bacterium]|nr:MAG: cysteine synthase family protein [Actinomycetota bacterium]